MLRVSQGISCVFNIMERDIFCFLMNNYLSLDSLNNVVRTFVSNTLKIMVWIEFVFFTFSSYGQHMYTLKKILNNVHLRL